MTMGKAAVYTKPHTFELIELPVPDVEAGGLLVKITSAGICGSDLHYWRGDISPSFWAGGAKGGVILGHEMTGVVQALGKGVTKDSMGRPLKEGDRVAYTYFFPCMRCYNCLRGELNTCPNRTRFRQTVEDFPYCTGGFSEYFYLPPGHFVFKMPDELGDELATSANCAVAQVIFGLRKAGIGMGDHVVVQGAGGLGINAVAAAKEMGAERVIAIDGQPGRLKLAEECGADDTIDIREYNTVETRTARVRELTEGRGADVVLELVGFPDALVEGFSLMRPGGKIVEIGCMWPNSTTQLDVSKFVWTNATVIGIAHYDPYILPVTLDFLVRTKDKYPLGDIMSHSFPLEKIDEAFQQSEWLGKDTGSAITRAFLKP
ncbi:MAG: zinc-binding dehydrogenase [Chloroflexi bacterium]|nr:zinc-binding dehydrogenase [Chloroflexota bacterium]